MNDAYRTPIICSTGRGIGADFWKRYKGPTERMEYAITDGYFTNTRKTTWKLVVCVDCGREFPAYRSTTVRCKPCSDERYMQHYDKREKARKARERAVRQPAT